METIKLATVCSGIGAPEKALKLLGIPYELVFFSDRGRDALSGLFYKRFGQRRRGGFRYKVKPYVVLRQTHCTDEAENRRVGERRRRSELQTLYDLP